MLVIGVRSSWLTLDTNASLLRSTSVRLATALRSAASAVWRAVWASARLVMSSPVARYPTTSLLLSVIGTTFADRVRTCPMDDEGRHRDRARLPEVRHRGGHPEDGSPDQRADHAGRSEAHQVMVVAQAPVSPPAGQDLVDHQALQGGPEGVPERHVPRVAAQDEAGQDHRGEDDGQPKRAPSAPAGRRSGSPNPAPPATGRRSACPRVRRRSRHTPALRGVPSGSPRALGATATTLLLNAWTGLYRTNWISSGGFPWPMSQLHRRAERHGVGLRRAGPGAASGGVRRAGWGCRPAGPGAASGGVRRAGWGCRR